MSPRRWSVAVDRPGTHRPTGAPTCGRVGPDSNPQPNATAAPATFTGEPSFVAQVSTGVFRVVRAVGDFLGVDPTIPLAQLLSSDSPPWFTTLGLNVQRSEFEGMPVWTLQSPQPSGKTLWPFTGAHIVAAPQHLQLARLRCHGPRHRRHRDRTDLPTGTTGHRRHRRPRHGGPDLLADRSARGRECQCLRRLRRRRGACRRAGIGASR